MTIVARSSASFTRPANTTAYAAGDLVANDVDAGDVVPMSFDLSKLRGAQGFLLNCLIIKKSTNTAANASFLLHLFRGLPVVTGGDNAAFAVGHQRDYVGPVPLDMTTSGVDITGGSLYLRYGLTVPGCVDREGVDTLYGLLEALAAYAPGSAEQFEVSLGMRV